MFDVNKLLGEENYFVTWEITKKKIWKPLERGKCFGMFIKNFRKKANTERMLRQKNHRLQAKIRTLNTLIDSLQADNKITANRSNILKVTYN